ncbi:hypothetical protein V8G54_027733 [Vigna mungo]|uniref:Uncharacterized protein n=1 Tax=Vigna mungo TaxID=3915 RepID=A0AAQ3MQP8_VIGMU
MQSTKGACWEGSGLDTSLSFPAESLALGADETFTSAINSSGVHLGGTETLNFVSRGLCSGVSPAEFTWLPFRSDLAIPLKWYRSKTFLPINPDESFKPPKLLSRSKITCQNSLHTMNPAEQRCSSLSGGNLISVSLRT